MKLIVALIILPLFLGSCGDKKETIQKNTFFIASCENPDASLDCPGAEGTVACGTKPGNSELLAYCIDKDDKITSKAECIVNSSDEKSLTSSFCIHRESKSIETKIQKNSSFQVVCKESSAATPRQSATCEETGYLPACGTVPGGITIQPYCIDSNDVISGLPYCHGHKNDPSFKTTCERIP